MFLKISRCRGQERQTVKRFISTLSKFLVENEDFSFLKELGLKKVNPGVYDGQWDANGEVSNQISYFKFANHLNIIFLIILNFILQGNNDILSS